MAEWLKRAFEESARQYDELPDWKKRAIEADERLREASANGNA